MNKLIEFYDREIRLPDIAAENYRCKHKKNLLKRINFVMMQNDRKDKLDFVKSEIYQTYLNEILSLNKKISNLQKKQIKLLMILSKNEN